MPIERIAIDYDNTLIPSAEGLLVWYNQLNGTDFTTDSFRRAFDYEAIGLDEATFYDLADRFHREGHSALLEPHPEAHAALVRLREAGIQPFISTARPHYLEDVTVKAISTHFGDVIEDVYLTEYEPETGNFKPKYEMCQELGAKSLIDDELYNAVPAAAQGILAVICGHRGWNLQYDPHPKLLHADHVGEAADRIIMMTNGEGV